MNSHGDKKQQPGDALQHGPGSDIASFTTVETD